MTTTQRIFTDEFKQGAVALLASSGRSLAPIARELRLQPSELWKWQRSLTTGADQASEIARVQMERNILEKLWQFSRKHRDEVLNHCGLLQRIPGSGALRCPRRVAIGLLCLAHATGEPTQGSEPTVA
ncbi:transposase [Azospirillum doebereinerae]|uniref:Transposase n=1 Tax=Azospirillum doebereinerae TaxID=92933 RepID=A0A433J5U6_9PROT|nr:transposase [Azospirillum doebereinerae]RUQ68107.1 hypothetical protein EJ913_18495 [Azospirillum doebereinerae]